MKLFLALLLIPTLCLGVTSGKAIHGSALKYDGTNDYVNVPDSNSLDITGAITLEAWVKPNVVTGNPYILSKEDDGGANGYAIAIDPNRKFELVLWGGSNVVGIRNTAGGTVVTAGNWYHVVGTCNNTLMKIYVNGVLDRQATGTMPAGTNTHALWLGDLVWSGIHYQFNGIIDEVRIYNRALDSTEIAWNYRHPSYPRDTSGCVMWLKCNEFTGDTTYDYSSQSNNGVLGGGTAAYKPTWVIDSPVKSGKQK